MTRNTEYSERCIYQYFKGVQRSVGIDERTLLIAKTGLQGLQGSKRPYAEVQYLNLLHNTSSFSKCASRASPSFFSICFYLLFSSSRLYSFSFFLPGVFFSIHDASVHNNRRPCFPVHVFNFFKVKKGRV